MSRWRKKKDKWLKLTLRELRAFKNRKKGQGLYHEAEKVVYADYKAYRNRGFKVTYDWLCARMRQTCKRLKPGGKSFDNYKGFGSSWARRFCLRWKISLQRKTTKKTVHYFERLHDINAHHRKLLYELQDPKNFEEENSTRPSWSNVDWYVNNHRDPNPGNDDDQQNKDKLVLTDSEISEDHTL